MPTVVRLARPADAALLAELGRATFTEAFAADNSPGDLSQFLDATYALDRQAAELADPACTIWIAEVDREPAGFALLRRGPAEPCITGPAPVELQRIYVLARFHGQGAAQALFQACLDRAVAEGFRTLWLGVWERNGRALAFYRKLGFRDVGSHVFMVGSDPQTDRILERPLPEVPHA